MTDNTEVQEVVQDTENQTIVQEATQKEYTQVEKEELEKGWKPDGKKSAEEFRAYRDEYNNSLERLRSELKEQRKSIEFLNKQNARIAEEGYNRAMEVLKKEQQEAALIGDAATVDKKTQEIVELNRNQLPATPNQEIPPEYVEFVNKHTWFVRPGQVGSAKNIAYTQYAQQREVELTQANPNLSPREILDLLEGDLKSSFPGLIREEQPAGVTPKSKTTSGAQLDYDGLSDFHKQMLSYMKEEAKKSNSPFDESQYIKDVKKYSNKK